MNPGKIVLFILLLVLSGASSSLAAEADIKGSKDHPLLTRMPDFRITDYKYNDFDSHRFNDQEKKHVVVEGHKYYLEYRLE